jgi:AcrR family transcriptional regulator
MEDKVRSGEHDDSGPDMTPDQSRDNGHARAHEAEHDQGRDTRSRLRELALQLFAEQGYEKTSLREIAERLGVTKAALYYYFKSKEDIVRSLVEDYFTELDELVAWAKVQPRNAATRAEIVNRYLDIVVNGTQVFRMLHQNQAAVSSLASAKERGALFRERMDALVDVLTEPGASLRAQVRAASSLVSISLGFMNFEHRASSPVELRAALLDVALELVDAAPANAAQ